jgi:hypothetical protein
MDEPPRNKDPVAVAVFSIAILLLLGLVVYVVFFLRRPEVAPGRPGLVEEVRRLAKDLQPKPDIKPEARRAERPAAMPSLKYAPPAGASVPLEAGRTWRYAVSVEPPVWRDITLTYRTRREGESLGVLTDFRYAGGQMNFHLGTFAPGHPSHANMRFPGFFMYASYFQLPLEVGQRPAWEWAWQPVRDGRVKRYDGRVVRWEDVQVPAGTYSAAVIEADLQYIEGGKVQARARETIWYAPKVFQVVKVVREGRTPDEGVERIVAELAEFR